MEEAGRAAEHPARGLGWLGALVRVAEALGLVALFGAVVHGLTAFPVSGRDVAGGLALIAVGGTWTAAAWWRGQWDALRLGARVCALLAGFWLFSAFRYVGYVRWPMGGATTLTGYAALLYYHFVFAALVLSAALVGTSVGDAGGDHRASTHWVAWGAWGRPGLGGWGRALLVASALGCWMGAGGLVVVWPLRCSGPLALLVGMAVLKGLMTALTEEIAFRGLIQPAATARFGVVGGLLVQMVLYVAFHVHLGQVAVAGTAFFVGLALLALVLGEVTRRSHGIGWACCVHTALDVMVEWGNLS